MTRFFAPVPLTFNTAFVNGGVGPGVWALGCDLCAEAFRTRNKGGDGTIAVPLAAYAERYNVHRDTISNWLRALATGGWCEIVHRPSKGQRLPWLVRLTGLDLRTTSEPPPNRPPTQFGGGTSEEPGAEGGANPHAVPLSTSPPPPNVPVAAWEKEKEKETGLSSLRYDKPARRGRAFGFDIAQDLLKHAAVAQGASSNPRTEEHPHAPEGDPEPQLRPCTAHPITGFTPWCPDCRAANGSEDDDAPGGARTNGHDAREQAVLAEVEALIAAGALVPEPPLCAYPAHRDAGRDWTNADGRGICGICHPRARQETFWR